MSDCCGCDSTAGINPGGGSPTGPAGGVLAGTYPNPSFAPGAILNADVNVAAAIAGTKINPDFGSQNIVTTGYLGIGLTPGSGAGSRASSGTIRLPDASTIVARNNTDTGNTNVLTVSAGTIVLGASAAFSSCRLTSTNVQLYASTTLGVTLTTTQMQIVVADLNVGNVGVNGTVRSFDNNIGNGSTLTVRGGNGTTSAIGGDLILLPGNATAGTNGTLRLRDGAGNSRIRIDGTGLSFFGAATVAQQADMLALTDSTTGTPGTTLVDAGIVYNQGNVNNNFSSVLTQINKVRTALRNYGLMA